MKKSLFLFLIVALILLSGCKEKTEMNNPIQIADFPISNSRIEEIAFHSYSLTELQNYFHQPPQFFYGDINFNYDSSIYDIKEINKTFPIECMRFNQNSYYSIYSVQEGGFFYVFWTCHKKDIPIINGIPYLEDASSTLDVSAIFWTYLSDNRNVTQFSFAEIIPGTSTFQDVVEIDPAVELSFLSSSEICSYSLLADGFLQITYEKQGNSSTAKNLVVNSLGYADYDSIICYLSSIQEEDLP